MPSLRKGKFSEEINVSQRAADEADLIPTNARFIGSLSGDITVVFMNRAIVGTKNNPRLSPTSRGQIEIASLVRRDYLMFHFSIGQRALCRD